jgi:hypothetical protein
MTLFLGTARVRVKHYGGGAQDYEVVRLVEADTPEEARAKFIVHYEKQTKEYSVYYNVIEADVSDVIS